MATITKKELIDRMPRARGIAGCKVKKVIQQFLDENRSRTGPGQSAGVPGLWGIRTKNTQGPQGSEPQDT